MIQRCHHFYLKSIKCSTVISFNDWKSTCAYWILIMRVSVDTWECSLINTYEYSIFARMKFDWSKKVNIRWHYNSFYSSMVSMCICGAVAIVWSLALLIIFLSVNMFNIKTCSFRHARSRSLAEGLFCLQTVEVCYELTACGNCAVRNTAYSIVWKSQLLISVKHIDIRLSTAMKPFSIALLYAYVWIKQSHIHMPSCNPCLDMSMWKIWLYWRNNAQFEWTYTECILLIIVILFFS
jgi:hypothetical protein